jgi:hypothetical protein
MQEVITQSVKPQILLRDLTPNHIIGFEARNGVRGAIVRKDFKKGDEYKMVAATYFTAGNCWEHGSFNKLISYIERLPHVFKVFVFDTDKELLKWLAE